jgi:hypothetical protein
MTALPEQISQAWQNHEGPVILATVGADGAPNIIYVTCTGMHGADGLVVADNYFAKTRANIHAGSRGALLFRDPEGKAYQVKGTWEYHSEGPVFAAMKQWNPAKHPGHAAALLRVEEVYSGAKRIC